MKKKKTYFLKIDVNTETPLLAIVSLIILQSRLLFII